jgi:hypothetical protein
MKNRLYPAGAMLVLGMLLSACAQPAQARQRRLLPLQRPK